MSKLLACFLAFAFPLSISSAQVIFDPDANFQAPALPGLAAPSIVVFPNGYRAIGSPFVTVNDYPLCRAIEAAEAFYVANPQTVVLEIRGVIPQPAGAQIGGGDAGQKKYRVEWQSAPIDVALVGQIGPATDKIYGFTIKKNRSDGTITPGVKALRVENVTIESLVGANSTVSTPVGLPPTTGTTYPLIQINECVLDRGGSTSKWGCRGEGAARWDVRDTEIHYYQEHGVYIDSPAGDTFFIDNTMDGATRTMIQVVNRTQNPAPCGSGYLLIEGNIATNITGDGGSDFTIAGHPGVVILRGNQSIEAPGQNSSQGSIAVWTDVGHGVCTVNCPSAGTSMSTKKVIIQNHVVNLPHADRDHVMIAGACFVAFRDAFSISGNKTAIHLNSPWGGPYANGSVCFHIPGFTSSYAGFQTPTQVKQAGMALSNAQIDALFCP